MSARMTNTTNKAIVQIAVALFCVAPSWAALVLPEPIYPNAVQYDDFYSYSSPVLTVLGYEGFDGTAGTGTLDLVLWSHNTVPNDDNGVYVFDPSIAEKKISTIPTSGTWSAPVTELLNYLQIIYDTSIPVFVYDLNQSQNEGDGGVLVNAYMSIVNSATESVVMSWALDNVIDDQFDPNGFIYAPPEITFTDYSGVVHTVDSNAGSGKADFLVYAPTMDLSLYDNPDYTFIFRANFMGLNNGAEEVFLTGAYAPTPPATVPEPATLVLFGLAIPALVLGRKIRTR